ncbi:hypothetical protein RvY_17607 [Ramazzottius varieornatus]|uniref:Uncharacterized protein n=1 Tax=Ramazzottius varieornatus TaxID=947166 RepID=A0A1D1W2Q0_RAMVA|nr:hypothetical protein RvY_17607 [Ramazzottius varieornatus]
MSIYRLFMHYEKIDTNEKPEGSFTTGEESLIYRYAWNSLGPRLPVTSPAFPGGAQSTVSKYSFGLIGDV